MPPRTTHCLVFTSGLALLVVEVAAVRVLRRGFAGDPAVVSCVLTVILAGLAAGYRAGGRLADRDPSPIGFFALFLAAGASTLTAGLSGEAACGMARAAFGGGLGPLVASAALFAPPSAALGALSPFAVRLRRRREGESEVGRSAGDVFFWGTAGSLIGGLLTGYVVLPALGAPGALLLVGVALSLVGAAGLARRSRRFHSTAVLLRAATWWPASSMSSSERTTAGRCAPRTSTTMSFCSAGSRTAATTEVSSSSTCATGEA